VTSTAVVGWAQGAPAPLGAPSVAEPGGMVFVADGQLQSALVPPRWGFAGFDGSFAVFTDHFATGPLSIQALPGRSASGALIKEVKGAPGEPAAATVSSPHGARVIRSVAAIPGWSATWQPLHGQTTTLTIQRDGLVQAVDVPAGQGVITWSYTSPGFLAGLALSLAAGLLVVLLLVAAHRGRLRTALAGWHARRRDGGFGDGTPSSGEPSSVQSSLHGEDMQVLTGSTGQRRDERETLGRSSGPHHFRPVFSRLAEHRHELDDLLKLLALGGEAGRGDPADKVAGSGGQIRTQPAGHVVGWPGCQCLDRLQLLHRHPVACLAELGKQAAPALHGVGDRHCYEQGRRDVLLVAANAAQRILLDGCAPELLAPPANAYRLALHPEGMAPRIVNFAEWARHVLHGISAELGRNPDDRLAALHEELSGYVPAFRLKPGHLGFAVPLRFRSPDGELSLMTTITSFATAADVTISELRLEAFLPADPFTASVLFARNEAAGQVPGRGPEPLGR
jgi:hypothetical protein